MATQTEINEIKLRLEIVDVVGEYVDLKKAGKNWRGLCPFHTEKTPSFHVNSHLGIYKCFGCDRGGDLIKFVQEKENLPFGEVLEKLAVRAGVTLTQRAGNKQQNQEYESLKKINTIVAQLYAYLLHAKSDKNLAGEYLFKQRGFNEKIVQLFALGYAPSQYRFVMQTLQRKGVKATDLIQYGLSVESKGGRRDKFYDRIMFPIHSPSGQVVGFSGRIFRQGDRRPKYLNSPETLLFKKRRNLYGIWQAKDAISKQDKVIIVEGQTDVISSFEAGVNHIVAPLGTGLTEDQLRLLARYSKNIVLATDHDSAGFKALLRGALLCTSLELVPYVLLYDHKYDDCDELIKQDIKLWKTTVQQGVVPFVTYLINLYLERKENIPNYINNIFSSPELVLRRILDFISQTKDPIKKEMYKQEISKKLNIDKSSLSDMILPTPTPHPLPPTSRALPNLTEYLLNLVLNEPTLIQLKPDILTYVVNSDHHFILQEIFYWQTKKAIGHWTKVTNKTKEQNLQNLLAYLVEQQPTIAQVIEKTGILPKKSMANLSQEYIALCQRLIRERSKQLISLLQPRLAQAEIDGDRKLIKKLTNQIQKLSSSL